jgi:hypothetical protein
MGRQKGATGWSLVRMLAEIAARERHEDRRRHMLDLAETHLRAADQIEAGPPAPQFPTRWR